MGFSRGTEVFDAVVEDLLDSSLNDTEIESVLLSLARQLSALDWDTESESSYFDNPVVQRVFRTVWPYAYKGVPTPSVALSQLVEYLLRNYDHEMFDASTQEFINEALASLGEPPISWMDETSEGAAEQLIPVAHPVDFDTADNSPRRDLVVWKIDIEGADSPEDAAAQAWGHMRRPDSTATYFEVTDKRGLTTTVDLSEDRE